MPSPFNFTGTAFGTLDTSSGIDNLPPGFNKPDICNLSVAENVRFTSDGGVRNRNGFQQKADLGTDAAVTDIETLAAVGVLFTKSGTKVKQSLDGETWYDTGLTRTTTEKDFLFPHENDMYVTNETDSFTRIATSTLSAVNSGAGTFSVATGDGDFFASGTVYIRGIAVTGGTLSGDNYTGATGLTAAMAVGDVVTQTSTPSGAPKGYCMEELQGSALVARGSTLSVSLPSTDQEPELFYDFTLANGATAKRLSSDITALKTGLGVTMIGMKQGIDVATGFEENSGALLTSPLSRVHSIPNNRCIVEMDRQFAILTTEGRIIPAMNFDTGFQLVEDPNAKRNFDYPVQKYIQQNKSSDNSQNFLHYDPAEKLLTACILLKTNVTVEIVCQIDIGAWSIDTSKNFRCKTNFNGRVYAGDDTTSLVYLDSEGWMDNEAAINSRITTGVFRISKKAITGDYLLHTFGGLLSSAGQFNMRVILDGDVLENKLYRAAPSGNGDSLQELMLMDVDTGIPIGSGLISSQQIGSGGQVADAFRFDIPYELMHDAQSAQLEWEITDEGTAFELRYFDLSGETEGALLLTHT